jgi:hypothetical protein
MRAVALCLVLHGLIVLIGGCLGAGAIFADRLPARPRRLCTGTGSGVPAASPPPASVAGAGDGVRRVARAASASLDWPGGDRIQNIVPATMRTTATAVPLVNNLVDRPRDLLIGALSDAMHPVRRGSLRYSIPAGTSLPPPAAAGLVASAPRLPRGLDEAPRPAARREMTTATSQRRFTTADGPQLEPGLCAGRRRPGCRSCACTA